jgi:hypothetical protein
LPCRLRTVVPAASVCQELAACRLHKRGARVAVTRRDQER